MSHFFISQTEIKINCIILWFCPNHWYIKRQNHFVHPNKRVTHDIQYLCGTQDLSWWQKGKPKYSKITLFCYSWCAVSAYTNKRNLEINAGLEWLSCRKQIGSNWDKFCNDTPNGAITDALFKQSLQERRQKKY